MEAGAMQQQLLSAPSPGGCVLPALQLQARALSSLDRSSRRGGGFPCFQKLFVWLGGVLWFGFFFPSYFWIFLASPARGKPGSSEGFPAVQRAMQTCAEHIWERDGSESPSPRHPCGDAAVRWSSFLACWGTGPRNARPSPPGRAKRGLWFLWRAKLLP